MPLTSTLMRPKFPRTALVLDRGEAAVVELRRRGRRFAVASAAAVPLDEHLLAPSFTGQNISDPEALAAAVYSAAEAAKLHGRSKWSMLLPESVVRSFVVTLESVPGSRSELADMIAFKTARKIGTNVRAEDLRISRQLLQRGVGGHFLVLAVRDTVAREYEQVASLLGWRVGLVVPRFVGEAAWLDWDDAAGDKIVVGTRSDGCIASIVRNREIVFVRSIDDDPRRFADEIYRLALFYRDRVADSPESAVISRILGVGSVDADLVASVVGEALGTVPTAIHAVPDLLDVTSGGAMPQNLEAAAGIASQAWAN
jgi:hypothetical protein